MERRRFLRNITTGSLVLTGLGSISLARPGKKITILHTNDTHSHIDPFPDNHKKYPNQGGINRRHALIETIREEEEQVLLLDAGDIFQGTPYFNVHGGELEMRAMTAMKYDAATMGNHDFDAGLDGFKNMLPFADFPFLCGNYNFENTVLNGLTKPYEIFEKGGLRVGVFGIGVELAGLVAPAFFGDTQYEDPIEKADYWAGILRNEHKCDLIICLSHLGYTPRLNKWCDTVLAEETSNIHLIIGGHTHTFMVQPELVKNKDGKAVLINQVGWAGLVLGRIDFYFDAKGNPDLFSAIPLSTNYSIG